MIHFTLMYLIYHCPLRFYSHLYLHACWNSSTNHSTPLQLHRLPRKTPAPSFPSSLCALPNEWLWWRAIWLSVMIYSNLGKTEIPRKKKFTCCDFKCFGKKRQSVSIGVVIIITFETTSIADRTFWLILLISRKRYNYGASAKYRSQLNPSQLLI